MHLPRVLPLPMPLRLFLCTLLLWLFRRGQWPYLNLSGHILRHLLPHKGNHLFPQISFS